MVDAGGEAHDRGLEGVVGGEGDEEAEAARVVDGGFGGEEGDVPGVDGLGGGEGDGDAVGRVLGGFGELLRVGVLVGVGRMVARCWRWGRTFVMRLLEDMIAVVPVSGSCCSSLLTTVVARDGGGRWSDVGGAFRSLAVSWVMMQCVPECDTVSRDVSSNDNGNGNG